MSENILEIKDLYVQYSAGKDTVRAVNGITLSLEKGESLGLVGETGAGKTTTALSIMGLIPNPPGKITGGEILYRGENLREKSEKEMRKIRGHEISMIFQDPMTALNPMLTVGDQIAEVIRLHQNVTKAEAFQRAKEMMEVVGIEGGRANEYPHQFSGGMKQRIVIAIALACNPSLLIADEPTTALDVTIQAQVLELIEQLKRKYDTSLLLITHDLGVVAEVCNKVAIIYAGEIVEYGTLAHIYKNPSHPYTIGLFGSIPNLNETVTRLKPIPGLMPDPTKLPEGCAFAERCGEACEKCMKGAVPYIEIEPGHMVRCTKFAGKEN
ncbi:MAG: ABC transporter ATP-binding protein [Clostridia bacterium]|nr:ABC transporter ATP-binding protein [Clostridia bacterium]MBQ7113445.1 ABC transporter ATP-binding protein [Clostridia bacterium]